MNTGQITQEKIAAYVEQHIPLFHQNRIEKLKKLKLDDVLKRKNPYLFKVKHVVTAGEFVKTILDAFLSSQEESLFGGFLETLAIYICQEVYGGRKSAAEGIDLEFNRDHSHYLVAIKSGPNWGNSSQIKRMIDNFKQAKRILGTNSQDARRVVAVNGCCYGKDKAADKGDYLKLCGQRFWAFISGDDELYVELIEPFGHRAKENNDQFSEEYAKVVNKFSHKFIEMFCDASGAIIWEKLLQLNSGAAA